MPFKKRSKESKDALFVDEGYSRETFGPQREKEPKAILAADPGLKGGICCLSGDKLVFLERMPLVRWHEKSEPDPVEITKLFSSVKHLDPIFYIEQVGAFHRPGLKISAKGMFSFGKGYGMLIGVAAALKIPMVLVRPKVWKQNMMHRLNKSDKENSIKLAKAIFPDADLKPGRSVRDNDGMAEAILIAAYGGKKEWSYHGNRKIAI
jgi:hypothetical protein